MTAGWRVDHYPRFEKAFRKLTKRDARLRAAVADKMKLIEKDPLMGDPKTGQMVGLRAVHVLDHWVLVWELRPTIVNPKFIDKLRELWFYDFYLHP